MADIFYVMIVRIRVVYSNFSVNGDTQLNGTLNDYMWHKVGQTGVQSFAMRKNVKAVKKSSAGAQRLYMADDWKVALTIKL